MVQFCGDLKCKFYDTFPDGNKFSFSLKANRSSTLEKYCQVPCVFSQPMIKVKITSLTGFVIPIPTVTLKYSIN